MAVFGLPIGREIHSELGCTSLSTQTKLQYIDAALGSRNASLARHPDIWPQTPPSPCPPRTPVEAP